MDFDGHAREGVSILAAHRVRDEARVGQGARQIGAAPSVDGEELRILKHVGDEHDRAPRRIIIEVVLHREARQGLDDRARRALLGFDQVGKRVLERALEQGLIARLDTLGVAIERIDLVAAARIAERETVGVDQLAARIQFIKREFFPDGEAVPAVEHEILDQYSLPGRIEIGLVDDQRHMRRRLTGQAERLRVILLRLEDQSRIADRAQYAEHDDDVEDAQNVLAAHVALPLRFA